MVSDMMHLHVSHFAQILSTIQKCNNKKKKNLKSSSLEPAQNFPIKLVTGFPIIFNMPLQNPMAIAASLL